MEDMGMRDADSKYGSYFFGQESLAHYYGNTVRQLFLAATTVMLLGAPFYVDVFRVQMPFIVLGAIVLVMLAALTSPQSRSVMMANAVAAGAGATLYEFWALAGFDTSLFQSFLRQLPALILILAFYFSLKTYRAMFTGIIGKGGTYRPAGSRQFLPTGRGNDVPLPTVERRHVAIDGLGRPAAEEMDKLD